MGPPKRSSKTAAWPKQATTDIDGVADTVNGGPHNTGDNCTTEPIDTVFNCNP